MDFPQLQQTGAFCSYIVCTLRGRKNDSLLQREEGPTEHPDDGQVGVLDGGNVDLFPFHLLATTQ
jgi:hypothetical protein